MVIFQEWFLFYQLVGSNELALMTTCESNFLLTRTSHVLLPPLWRGEKAVEVLTKGTFFYQEGASTKILILVVVVVVGGGC